MPEALFEWDAAKNEINKRKHGITFEEASEVFGDPLALEAFDPDHSEAEDRYITLGRARRGVILVVSHTDRFGRIRIISARLAAKSEVRQYEQKP